MRNLTALIPARGGSKQVVRKNLRLIAGQPLVAHAIDLARSAADTVIVSTDDADIAAVARLKGAGVVHRSAELASDEARVDDVVMAFRANHDGPLLVIQPTVVGVTVEQLAEFVAEWHADGMKTTRLMVTPSAHIYWQNGEPLVDRANRQDITGPVLGEIGIRLYPERGVTRFPDTWTFTGPIVDIDTPGDLLVARHMMERKRILFRVLANQQVGHGHLRRVLTLAEELQHHDIGITLHPDTDANILDLIPQQWHAMEFAKPDVLVNDTLDTSHSDFQWLDRSVSRIHFEDKGPGAQGATIINALYPGDGEYGGPDWFMLRPEFHVVPKTAGDGVLITFGGTDPAGLTESMCKKLVGLNPRVIAPPGRKLGDVPDSVVVVEGASVAEEIARAKVVVTGGGRTVYESLFAERPVVAVCQNPRESTHSHLNQGFGVYPAGLAGFGGEQSGALAALNLMTDPRMWGEFHDRTRNVVDGKGVARCVTVVEEVADGRRR
jgi:spore coat polysaccharide biosynthesis predicted glycosyltransferase SpsG/GTP:adenosylcobinamide-phosphate guanylyltransferase